jgi:tripeptide aminopeptidase
MLLLATACTQTGISWLSLRTAVAYRRAGLKPEINPIRGGTDGSRLSFMGLPIPNIFAGEHNFHSRFEWISIQDMHKAV